MSGSDFVLLRRGVSVPAAPYLLVIDLEARGITITRDGADLLVGPRDRLTDEDERAIRASKADIMQLLDFMADSDLDAHLFTDGSREAVNA